MSSLNLLVLPGDGIGPEVTEEALLVLERACAHAGVSVTREEAAFGGASLDAHGEPVTEQVLEKARAADAVLLGAVGGPKWDDLPSERRPERGLLRLRATLEVFANLRPARFFEALAGASPLRPELTRGVELLVVRELIGGIYFGEPRGIDASGPGGGPRRGVNTMVYDADEIRRIGRVAFEIARARSGRLTSVDKANVLEVMALWREVMTDLGEAEYPDVALEHLYVDNCAMQLVRDPRQFDVIVTGNLFGDIVSDEAAALTGSLGMLPSASLGQASALYEPVHGSAPDIAGKGAANPLAMILSVAMLLEHTLKRSDLARAVEASAEAALESGLRTADLASGAEGERVVGTREMGAAVLAALEGHLEHMGEGA
ncbi:MAG: 3-isopropylmalate dehydrogenase [Myxococcota bacterium]